MACKRPRSFYQKCGRQVTPKHTNILDPAKSEWIDYATVQASYGNLSGNELTCNFSGNTRPQSSKLAEPLWIDPGLQSGINVYELISTLKRQGMNGQPFSPNPCKHIRARTLWYRGPFRRFINTRFLKNIKKGMDRSNKN